MLNEVVKEQDFHDQGSQFQLHNAPHHHLVGEKHEHDWLAGVGDVQLKVADDKREGRPWISRRRDFILVGGFVTWKEVGIDKVDVAPVPRVVAVGCW